MISKFYLSILKFVVKRLYNNLDKNKDGKLSIDELTEIINTLSFLRLKIKLFRDKKHIKRDKNKEILSRKQR